VVNGEPIWRICAGDLCVESRSGAAAWRNLRRRCRDAGVTLAATGITGPSVGGSICWPGCLGRGRFLGIFGTLPPPPIQLSQQGAA
jgi:hypothetical protein